MHVTLHSKPISMGRQHFVGVYFTLLRGLQRFSVSQVTKKKSPCFTLLRTLSHPLGDTVGGHSSQAGRSDLGAPLPTSAACSGASCTLRYRS